MCDCLHNLDKHRQYIMIIRLRTTTYGNEHSEHWIMELIGGQNPNGIINIQKSK